MRIGPFEFLNRALHRDFLRRVEHGEGVVCRSRNNQRKSGNCCKHDGFDMHGAPPESCFDPNCFSRCDYTTVVRHGKAVRFLLPCTGWSVEEGTMRLPVLAISASAAVL